MTAGDLRVSPFLGTTCEWNAAVMAQPGWTVFHRREWQTIIERSLGHRTHWLAAYGPDGTVDGLMPLVSVRSALFGRYLVSMPFVNYGGPLGTPAAVEALGLAAAEQAEAERAKLLELRARTPLAGDLPVSHRKVTVLLDLPEGDSEPLWRGFPSKLRSQIRRPQKAGVVVRFGLDQVDPFYRVFARHMRDLGTPVMPRKFFSRLAEDLPDATWFGCAYLDGQAIAAGAGFHWGDEFEMTWASALVEHKKLSGNMLLYWAFMERCVEHGIRSFDFGRCTPGGGTHRFKLQWGGREERLWWYHQPGSRVEVPSPDAGAYSWGPRLWKRLPLPIASLLGPRVVRGIP